jgi:hypothetical protein
MPHIGKMALWIFMKINVSWTVPVISIIITRKAGTCENGQWSFEVVSVLDIIIIIPDCNCLHATERDIYSRFCFYMSNYSKLLFVQLTTYAESKMTCNRQCTWVHYTFEVCKNSESNAKFLYALEEGQMRKDFKGQRMKGERLDGVSRVRIAQIILVAV